MASRTTCLSQSRSFRRTLWWIIAVLFEVSSNSSRARRSLPTECGRTRSIYWSHSKKCLHWEDISREELIPLTIYFQLMGSIICPRNENPIWYPSSMKLRQAKLLSSDWVIRKHFLAISRWYCACLGNSPSFSMDAPSSCIWRKKLARGQCLKNLSDVSPYEILRIHEDFTQHLVWSIILRISQIETILRSLVAVMSKMKFLPLLFFYGALYFQLVLGVRFSDDFFVNFGAEHTRQPDRSATTIQLGLNNVSGTAQPLSWSGYDSNRI